MIDDPYKVLGVTPDTPPDEIKKAYEEGGGGITGAMSAVMTAVKGIFDDAYNVITSKSYDKAFDFIFQFSYRY